MLLLDDEPYVFMTGACSYHRMIKSYNFRHLDLFSKIIPKILNEMEEPTKSSTSSRAIHIKRERRVSDL